VRHFHGLQKAEAHRSSDPNFNMARQFEGGQKKSATFVNRTHTPIVRITRWALPDTSALAALGEVETANDSRLRFFSAATQPRTDGTAPEPTQNHVVDTLPFNGRNSPALRWGVNGCNREFQRSVNANPVLTLIPISCAWPNSVAS
jgi:hypothetical protein